MNSEEMPENQNYAEKFQKDFITGCLNFITIAATVKGDHRSCEEIFHEMTDPIIGNRDRNRTGFDSIMPELYKKVIEYCHEAINISEDIENKELQSD